MEMTNHDKFLIDIIDLRNTVENVAKYTVKAHSLPANDPARDVIMMQLHEAIDNINTTSKEMQDMWPEFIANI